MSRRVSIVDVETAVINFEQTRRLKTVPLDEICKALDIALPILDDLIESALQKAPWLVRLIAGGLVRSIQSAIKEWQRKVCPVQPSPPSLES